MKEFSPATDSRRRRPAATAPSEPRGSASGELVGQVIFFVQDWSNIPQYKGRKLAPTTPEKTTMKPAPADKVFTLVPRVETQPIPTATAKVVRLCWRTPKNSIPTFHLSQGEVPSVEQPSSDKVSKPSSKQHIPVFIYVCFHLFAKTR